MIRSGSAPPSGGAERLADRLARAVHADSERDGGHAELARRVLERLALGPDHVEHQRLARDLPSKDNRVTVTPEGRIKLDYTPNNVEAHVLLTRKLRRIVKDVMPLGFQIAARMPASSSSPASGWKWSWASTAGTRTSRSSSARSTTRSSPSRSSCRTRRRRAASRRRAPPSRRGTNQLAFEDAAGKERVFVRAERDLEFLVNHDRETRIGNDDRLDVSATRHVAVEKDLVYEVKGKRDATIEGADRLEVRGGLSTVVTGDSFEKVIGTRRTDLVGEDRRSIEGIRETVVKGDSITDIRGNAALIVGRNDAKRSVSALVEGMVTVLGSGAIQITSDTEIILHVKDSFIRISESGIELGGGSVSMRGEGARMNIADGEAKIQTDKMFQVVSSDEIKMKTDGGNIGLTKSEAKVAGTMVKLGSATTATDEENVTPPEPAKIELVDQDGKPVPNQRFVIDLESGGQVTGFLDDKGKATVFLDAPGDISFPDLAEVDG